MGWIRQALLDTGARVLTKPRRQYHRIQPNNLAKLRRLIRKGDVLLVDGDQRISEVIKYLTQSSWSHVALYAGDELLRRHPGKRAELTARFGIDAEHLLVEALLEGGVVVSPLSKYELVNVRLCRPRGLRPEHLTRILDEVLAQIGMRYDVRTALGLARYFFPVSLIPRRWRRTALDFGSPLTREVICSSMIARAFDNVGFPVMPTVVSPGNDHASRGRLAFLRRGGGAAEPPVFRHQSPHVITPRDFDLSPYFDIVKFNAVDVDEAHFDYRQIRWENDAPAQRKGVS
ncbi:MAG TPA: YiiX/YebB-like N1pC/P60 family cysteine hydrolase [Candidatus Limnocylindria bacterium]|nr:YiiX/YebB-like N1pC/P60 family cysteine hydrolase [Candidatus Limnocylindria bacterium]